jgi:hypothetical protein
VTTHSSEIAGVKYQKGWSPDGIRPLLLAAFAIRMSFGARRNFAASYFSLTR